MSTPPFDPPYKTITRTSNGVFATETLADGSTRDLGEVPAGSVIPLDAPPPSNERIVPKATSSKGAKGPSTTTAGNAKAALYLTVPFAEKDQAKAKGARWDADKKKWYAPHGKDLNDFKPWWPDDMQ